MSDNYKSFLRFTRPELTTGLNRLISSLESKEATDLFVSNPVGMLSQHFPETIGKVNVDKISEANRLVFSIMANDKFRDWAVEYSNNIKQKFTLDDAKKLDKSKLRMDLAKAILDSGDKEIIYSLLGEQTRHDGLTTEDMQSRIDSVVTVETAIAVIAVAVIHVVVTAIDFTPKVPPTGPDLSLLSENAGADLRSISEQLVKSAKKFNKGKI